MAKSFIVPVVSQGLFTGTILTNPPRFLEVVLSNPSPGTSLGTVTNASVSIEPSTTFANAGFERLYYHVREGMTNPVVTTYGNVVAVCQFNDSFDRIDRAQRV